MLFFLSLLSAASFATSRFEARYGTFAALGLAAPVTARLDELLRHAPYFEDLALRLHRAFDARSREALAAFTCAGSLLPRETFLAEVGRARERALASLHLASHLEVGDEDFKALGDRLVAVLDRPAEWRDLLTRLERADAPIPPGELTAEIDRVLRARGDGPDRRH